MSRIKIKSQETLREKKSSDDFQRDWTKEKDKERQRHIKNAKKEKKKEREKKIKLSRDSI